MALETEATRLYALLPRNRRDELYHAVMKNPLFPFHHDEYSYIGRYFLVATGDYTAPASNEPLNIIINDIVTNEGYNDAQKNDMYKVYIEEIEKLTGAEYKRRGRNLSTFKQTIGRDKTPRNHAIIPEGPEAIVRSFLSGIDGPRRLGRPENEEILRLKQLASGTHGASGSGTRKSRKNKSRKSRKGRSRKF
jgi:hypothetical protein